jgi:hypothetical protein
MESTFIPLGIDAGNGAFKIFGRPGGLQVLSQVATDSGQRMVNTLGLHKQKPPLQVVNGHGAFYVGAEAHDYGRPVENLDVDRFNGTPEMAALLHGSLTRYQEKYGLFDAPLAVVTGLPNELLAGEDAPKNIENVKRWIKGTHTWRADGQEYSVQIAEVKVASQATGGLFDYLLNDQGLYIPERKKALTGEAGIISVGFGTVELMVVRDRTQVQRFTTGAASGVRRLLELVNGQRLYSLGELDLLLRSNELDLSTAMPIWEREVGRVIGDQWGNQWKRFSVVLAVGGGTILLRNSLIYRFGAKIHIPEDPVQSIAHGLYKMALFQQARREH